MHGYGGAVVIYTEGIASVFGTISAQGGSEFGNGGFVEVSGIDGLRFDSQVDVSAGYGDIGALVLRSEFLDVDNGISIPDRNRFANGSLTNIFDNSFARFGSVNFNTLNLQTGNVRLESTDDIGIAPIIHQELEVPNDETTFIAGNIVFIADSDGNGEGSLTLFPESETVLGEKSTDNNEISDGASEADTEIGGSPITAIDIGSENNGLLAPSEPAINPDEPTSPPIAAVPEDTADSGNDFDNSTPDTGVEIPTSASDNGSFEPATSENDLSPTNEPANPIVSEPEIKTNGNGLSEPVPEINPEINNSPVDELDNVDLGTSDIATTADNPKQRVPADGRTEGSIDTTDLNDASQETDVEIASAPTEQISSSGSEVSASGAPTEQVSAPASESAQVSSEDSSDSDWTSQDLLCEQNSVSNSLGNSILTIDESLLADRFSSDATASDDQCNSQTDSIPKNASTNDIDDVSRLDEVVDAALNIASPQVDVSSSSETLSGPIVEPISDIPSFAVVPTSPESF